MTLTDIFDLLTSIDGFSAANVAYNFFPDDGSVELPSPPYICYYVAGSNNFGADNVVYQAVDRVIIELYTRGKSPETEASVEAALTSAEIYWERSEDHDDTDRIYQITYEIEVFENG